MLRITAGDFKGRSIRTPSNSKTRPTQAKLRQALFNSIQASIPDARVLDLFAGSGALGFEALSRGAQDVVFVESVASVSKLIQSNAESLEVSNRVQLLVGSVDLILGKLLKLGTFDLVLADPPYDGGWTQKLLFQYPWKELLVPNGIFCLEWGLDKTGPKELPNEVPFLVKIREKNYGDSVLTTFQRTEEKG